MKSHSTKSFYSDSGYASMSYKPTSPTNYSEANISSWAHGIFSDQTWWLTWVSNKETELLQPVVYYFNHTYPMPYISNLDLFGTQLHSVGLINVHIFSAYPSMHLINYIFWQYKSIFYFISIFAGYLLLPYVTSTLYTRPSGSLTTTPRLLNILNPYISTGYNIILFTLNYIMLLLEWLISLITRLLISTLNIPHSLARSIATFYLLGIAKSQEISSNLPTVNLLEGWKKDLEGTWITSYKHMSSLISVYILLGYFMDVLAWKFFVEEYNNTSIFPTGTSIKDYIIFKASLTNYRILIYNLTIKLLKYIFYGFLCYIQLNIGVTNTNGMFFNTNITTRNRLILSFFISTPIAISVGQLWFYGAIHTNNIYIHALYRCVTEAITFISIVYSTFSTYALYSYINDRVNNIIFTRISLILSGTMSFVSTFVLLIQEVYRMWGGDNIPGLFLVPILYINHIIESSLNFFFNNRLVRSINLSWPSFINRNRMRLSLTSSILYNIMWHNLVIFTTILYNIYFSYNNWTHNELMHILVLLICPFICSFLGPNYYFPNNWTIFTTIGPWGFFFIILGLTLGFIIFMLLTLLSANIIWFILGPEVL